MQTFVFDDLQLKLGAADASGQMNEAYSAPDAPIQRHGFDLATGRPLHASPTRRWAKWDCYGLSPVDIKLQETRMAALELKSPRAICDAIGRVISMLRQHACFAERLEDGRWAMRQVCEKHQPLFGWPSALEHEGP